MEKRDIVVILGAIIIVLILAVVVKPILTGQTVVLLPEAPQNTVIAPPPLQERSEIPPAQPAPQTPVPTMEPGLSQSGDQNMNATVQHPSLTPPSKMTWQPDAGNPMPAIQMVNYAVINGKYTGNTATFRIPTPYWEIYYNITPNSTAQIFSMDIIEKGKEEKIIRTITYRPGKEHDPMESRFFEGNQDYFLNITAQNLDQYRITIQIPIKYIQDS